ncbi:MAG TPA: GFA family protein [Steroidobacteraceae bacterium]|jgi:hypothetical protein
MEKTSTGSCMCGQVRYEVRGALRDVICCHCDQCRRSSGHFVAATACRKTNFRLLNSDTLRWYSAKPDMRRGFCGACGSNLFFEPVIGERISIAAGCLDQPQGLKIAAHIFAAEAGDYYRIEPGVPAAADGTHAVALPP